jgi:lysophospholipase L1-like esterase
MKKMRLQSIFLSLCLLLACEKKAADNMTNLLTTTDSSLTYLALGDSYTIGEAVTQKESFPYQLVSQLNVGGDKFSDPKIIAKTGWTTSELQGGIKADQNLLANYDFVTLLIGVNNQYRGNSIEEYRKEFKALLQTAVNLAGGNKKGVFVVSIPDWGVTAFGKASGRELKVISKEIDEFNAVNKEETQIMGVSYIDITPASRNAATDPSLIASDGLHPAGKMYATWAAAVAPKVMASF